jgi:hypothetical protein
VKYFIQTWMRNVRAHNLLPKKIPIKKNFPFTFDPQPPLFGFHPGVSNCEAVKKKPLPLRHNIIWDRYLPGY